MFSPSPPLGQAPSSTPARLIAALAGALVALVLFGGVAAAQPAAPIAAQPPTVDVVQVQGVLDRSVAGYLAERVEVANSESVQALVIQLDTPGSIGPQAAEVVTRVAESRVPVVVWVGPAEAEARGAGALLAVGGAGLLVAPEARLGPAVPLDLRAAADPAAVRSRLAQLAAAHGRDPDAAAALADQQRVASPAGLEGLTPLAVPGLPDVLRELDGLEVTIADPGGGVRQTLDIDPAQVRVRFHSMGLVRRVLHTVASPTLCYLLLMAGLLALAFELFQPGFGVAGVGGALVTALGAYGLTVLPVNWLALVLLVVGLALLAADLAIGGLGLLTFGGTALLAGGSWWLFTGPAALRVPLWLIAVMVVFCLVYFVVILTTVLRAQGQQARAGTADLVGRVGVVRSMLNPEGLVFVNGALWRARAPEAEGRVPNGTPVRVVGLNDRLTLDVQLVESGDSTPVGT